MGPAFDLNSFHSLAHYIPSRTMFLKYRNLGAKDDTGKPTLFVA
jgi:hypothetical protein